MVERWRVPEPRRWGGRDLWDSHEIDVLAAQLAGRPPPERPAAPPLITIEQVAARLGLAPATVQRRVRIERREASAQSPPPPEAA